MRPNIVVPLSNLPILLPDAASDRLTAYFSEFRGADTDKNAGAIEDFVDGVLCAVEALAPLLGANTSEEPILPGGSVPGAQDFRLWLEYILTTDPERTSSHG